MARPRRQANINHDELNTWLDIQEQNPSCKLHPQPKLWRSLTFYLFEVSKAQRGKKGEQYAAFLLDPLQNLLWVK